MERYETLIVEAGLPRCLRNSSRIPRFIPKELDLHSASFYFGYTLAWVNRRDWGKSQNAVISIKDDNSKWEILEDETARKIISWEGQTKTRYENSKETVQIVDLAEAYPEIVDKFYKIDGDWYRLNWMPEGPVITLYEKARYIKGNCYVEGYYKFESPRKLFLSDTIGKPGWDYKPMRRNYLAGEIYGNVGVSPSPHGPIVQHEALPDSWGKIHAPIFVIKERLKNQHLIDELGYEVPIGFTNDPSRVFRIDEVILIDVTH